MSQVALRRPPRSLIKAGNPFVRGILRSPLHGIMDKSLLLLSVTGRKTGRVYTFPVGFARLDGVITIVTDHGWRLNVRGGAEVRVVLEGARLKARGELIEDRDRVLDVTRRLVTQAGGWKKASRLGFSWHGEDEPSDDELAPALEGRAIVVLTDLHP